jgi:hypothetical protein
MGADGHNLPAMNTASPDDVRRRHVDALGEQMGPVFHALHDDFYWLQSKWQEYVELYGKRETVQLLNAAAPSFAYLLDGVFWEDILLHLARLTDSETTGRGRGMKRNLTFNALPALCPDPSFRNELQQLVAAAVDASAYARDWRNRRLAHRDLPLAMGTAKPLATSTRKDVDAALEALHRVLEAVYARYYDSTLRREVALSGRGAERLLSVLRDGVAVQRARMREILGEG